MKLFFIFFIRLFFCFVVAKFILRVLGLDTRGYLLALTVLFMGNIYWFDYLEYRDRISFYLQRLKKAETAAADDEADPAPPPPGDSPDQSEK